MKFLVFVCVTSYLIFADQVLANGIKVIIPPEKIQESKFGNVTPITYLVNQNGELIYKKKGPARDLIRSFSDNPTLSNSSSEIAKINAWLPEKFSYSDFEFTIVLVRDDNYIQCPKCKQHEDRIDKVLTKLSDKNIAFVQLINDLGENVNFSLVSPEEMKAIVQGQEK